MLKVISQALCGKSVTSTEKQNRSIEKGSTAPAPNDPNSDAFASTYLAAQHHLHRSQRAKWPIAARRLNALAMDAFHEAYNLAPDHLGAHTGLLQAVRERRYLLGLRPNKAQQAQLHTSALQCLSNLLARHDATEAEAIVQVCDDLFTGALRPETEVVMRRDVIPRLGAAISLENPVGLPIVVGLRTFLRLIELQPWTSASIVPWLSKWSFLSRTEADEIDVATRLLKRLVNVHASLAEDVLEIVTRLRPRLQDDAELTGLCVTVLAQVCTVASQVAPLLKASIQLLEGIGKQFPIEVCGYEATQTLLRIVEDPTISEAPLNPVPEVGEAALIAARNIALEAGSELVALPLRTMVQRSLERIERQALGSLAFTASEALAKLEPS